MDTSCPSQRTKATPTLTQNTVCLLLLLLPEMTSSNQTYPCDGYDQAEAWCRQTIASGHDMMFSLPFFHAEVRGASDRFGLPFEVSSRCWMVCSLYFALFSISATLFVSCPRQAIHSMFRNAHVTHMKRTSHIIRSQTTRHVQSYLNGTSILNIARKVNYPPSMMARLIIENVAVPPTKPSTINGARNSNSGTNLKKFITEAIRHPEKTLGCSSSSISPEYLFSENKGSGAQNNERENHDSLIRLSRLSLEVRGAVDSDPMYGEFEDFMR